MIATPNDDLNHVSAALGTTSAENLKSYIEYCVKQIMCLMTVNQVSRLHREAERILQEAVKL